jgi:hypothetical protein
MYVRSSKDPWNKGKLVGQKAPLKLKEIWAIRIRLQLAHRTRDLALFNLAIDSKLRGCDLVVLRVRDICHGNTISNRAIVMQKKTAQPVQFEVTDQTKTAVAEWINCPVGMQTIFCSPAAFGILAISPQGNMRASFGRG